jgi:hypothetical protein
MKSIRKKLKGYFGMSRVYSSSRYITVHGGTPLLVGFIDSDWVNDPNDRNSTIGYIFILGYGPITLAYKKQQVIYTFSVEAEYQATLNESQETLWL